MIAYTAGRFFIITWQYQRVFNFHSCEACLWRFNLGRFGFGWYRK